MCFFKETLGTSINLHWSHCGEDDVEGCSRQDKQRLVGNAETSREPSQASGNYKPAFIEVVIV